MEIPTELMAFMDESMQRAAVFMEKVMVFIDGGYWRRCLEDQFKRVDVDMSKVITKILRGRRLIRTYFYTAKIERPPDARWKELQSEQQKFFTALAYQSCIEIRTGRLRFGDDNQPHQKGVDVLLALDMLRFALKGNYDTAILISGDGDFADIARMVKDEGRRVEIVTFPGTGARSLIEACDEYTEVTSELLDECWISEKEENEEG